MKEKRIEYIDATRGTAMLFVCLSHFAFIFFYKTGPIKSIVVYEIFAKVSMVATPTFLMISGLMLGYLYKINPLSYGSIKGVLIDRGFFLITIGHMLINIALIPSTNDIKTAFLWIFATDTIGFSIIVGSILIGKLKPSQRIILSLLFYSISWIAILHIHPDNIILRGIKETIIGPWKNNLFNYNFPLLPWFCFYFVHTYLGEKIADYQLKGDNKKIEKILLRTAFCYLLGAITVKICYKLMYTAELIPIHIYLIALQSPFQKLPPSPVYLLFYGGIGLLILYCLFRFRERSFVKFYSKAISVMGRASLFVFVLQYYLYFIILYYANISYANIKYIYLAPIIFLMSLIVLYRIAKIWDDHNLNKYLSVRRLGFKF